LADIYRERKDYAAELKILLRFAQQGHKRELLERLQKAQALLDAARKAKA
jgi:hypothetical protein